MALPAPAYEYIDTPPAFQAFLRATQPAVSLALDLEMENQRHYYGLHVALIQISTPGHRHFIIDPQVGLDLAPLAALLDNPAVELILHDAEFDRHACRAVYGWNLPTVFDTKIAAQLCGIRQFGLASLLQNLLAIQTNKKYQKMNWLKRPIPRDALDYAARDTASLHALKDLLGQRLAALGRLEWAREEFRLAAAAEPAADPLPAHHRIKKSALLTPRELAVLGAVVAFRDTLAQELNRPAHFVMRNDLLIPVAQTPPGTLEALRALRGLHPALYSAQHGLRFLEAVRRGQAAPEEMHTSRRPRARSKPDYEERLKAMQTWRALFAAPYGLEPYLMLANDVLHDAARHPDRPLAPEAAAQLRAWQRPLVWEPFRRHFKLAAT